MFQCFHKSILLRVVMLALLVSASGAPSVAKPKSAAFYEDSIEQGRAAYQAAEYKKAANLFKGALKEGEKSGRGTIEEIRTLNDLAASYCCDDELTKARDRCAQALALCVSSLKKDDPLLTKTKQRYDFLSSKSTSRMHKDELQTAWMKFGGGLLEHPTDVVPGPSDALPADEHGELTRKHKEPSFLMKILSKAHFWTLSYFFVAQNGSNCDLFYGLIRMIR